MEHIKLISLHQQLTMMHYDIPSTTDPIVTSLRISYGVIDCGDDNKLNKTQEQVKTSSN